MMEHLVLLHINPEHFVLKPYFATIHCEPNWAWRKRKAPMPNFDLFYVWSGHGEMNLNGKRYALRPHSCFLFRAGDVNDATHRPDHPLVLTYIHFDLAEPATQIPAPYRVVNDFITLETLLSRYVKLFLTDAYGAEVEAKLILKQAMIHLLREEQDNETVQSDGKRKLDEAILEVANYVRVHPGFPHNVEHLAMRANMSPKYFSQRFKEKMGQTLRSYIVESRIRRAEHLLHVTGMSVTETAYALGYNDMHFFSRQFKQHTGRNPSEIR